MSEIKTIGVLTSGGDAPGMNAAIRAVVRAGLNDGLKVKGIHRGYLGLIEEEITDMDTMSVSDIVHRGGTILNSSRCMEMMKPEGQKLAADNARKHNIDGIVVIGGDGSFKGAQRLSENGINTIALPGTIDLDIACTEYTIGFDTAVNTAMEAIDKIRDTSASHERCSIIEVMGRTAGHIALWCGISSGADYAMIPSATTETNQRSLRRSSAGARSEKCTTSLSTLRAAAIPTDWQSASRRQPGSRRERPSSVICSAAVTRRRRIVSTHPRSEPRR